MRLLTLSLLTLFASSPLIAEDYNTSSTSVDKPAVTVGLQGGMSFASAATPVDISSSTYTGFMGGLNVQFALNSILSLQPELMYVQRGANLVNVAGVSLTAKSDSLEVPLLLRVNFGERVRPYVFAGPVAIFNIANRLVGSSGGSAEGVSYNPRSIDIAADVGAGIEFESLFLNLRYSAGLLNNDAANGQWKSRGFQLLAGVNLGV